MFGLVGFGEKCYPIRFGSPTLAVSTIRSNGVHNCCTVQLLQDEEVDSGHIKRHTTKNVFTCQTYYLLHRRLTGTAKQDYWNMSDRIPTQK